MSQNQPPLWWGVPLAKAQVICVFVHGRGQSPEDMVAAVLSRLSAENVAFCLPRAVGGAWYAARAVDPLTEGTRAEVADACDHVERLVQDARKAAPGVPLVVAGFSQGACLALEWLCRGGTTPAALAAFTGCRVGLRSDLRAPPALHGLPIYLTGSDADPWIPVAAFAEAVASLGQAGAMLRADLFPGRPHDVSGAEIAMLDGVLRELAAGKPITFGGPR